VTKVERADFVVEVPRQAKSKSWSADQAQVWARKDILSGGPPAKPEDPSSGKSVDWSQVKEWAGRRLRIRAQPMGLIVTSNDGGKKFTAGDATPSTGGEGFSLGTTTNEMRSRAGVEKQLRTFAQTEVARYNKSVTGELRTRLARPTTREFWESGKRIREFIERHSGRATQDAVWFSLAQWGRGELGYGKNWLEYATYFYDWLPNAIPTDPVFLVSETRVMNILRADKNSEVRRRLLEASLTGVLSDFSDEEFKWITGQSPSTFPLDSHTFKEFEQFGNRVEAGLSLALADLERVAEIRAFLKTTTRRRIQASDTSSE
jgi:hypothetical protein